MTALIVLGVVSVVAMFVFMGLFLRDVERVIAAADAAIAESKKCGR